jgi:hypothetical protein
MTAPGVAEFRIEWFPATADETLQCRVLRQIAGVVVVDRAAPDCRAGRLPVAVGSLGEDAVGLAVRRVRGDHAAAAGREVTAWIPVDALSPHIDAGTVWHEALGAEALLVSCFDVSGCLLHCRASGHGFVDCDGIEMSGSKVIDIEAHDGAGNVARRRVRIHDGRWSDLAADAS